MDQGSAVRCGPKVKGVMLAAVLRNATRVPSFDHAGSQSRSTLGSRYRSVFALTSKTPTKLWSPRSLTKASREPSGENRTLEA
jgi:hypothetical protein